MATLLFILTNLLISIFMMYKLAAFKLCVSNYAIQLYIIRISVIKSNQRRNKLKTNVYCTESSALREKY